MDNQIVFQVAGILVGTGICAGIVKLIYKCGKVMAEMSHLSQAVEELKPHVQAIRQEITQANQEIAEIKSKVEILWQDRNSSSHSPRALNARGEEIFKTTGIEQVVKSRLADILKAVRALNPKNAYQAEQAVISAVTSLKLIPEINRSLQERAFRTSASVDEVLFVGAIYIRDQVIDTLNIHPE